MEFIDIWDPTACQRSVTARASSFFSYYFLYSAGRTDRQVAQTDERKTKIISGRPCDRRFASLLGGDRKFLIGRPKNRKEKTKENGGRRNFVPPVEAQPPSPQFQSLFMVLLLLWELGTYRRLYAFSLSAGSWILLSCIFYYTGGQEKGLAGFA